MRALSQTVAALALLTACVAAQSPLGTSAASASQTGVMPASSSVSYGSYGNNTAPAGSGNMTYTNPVLDGVGADPWVVRDGNYYYLMFTTTDNITMYRSRQLTNWNDADSKLVFNPPKGQPFSTDLWAPEIHNFDGRWYVIFTADPYADSPPPEQTQFCTFDCPAVNHRMYVLESSGSDIWSSNYTMKGQLETFDQFAIDGTYFRHDTGLYHIYSCWFDALQSWPANLCVNKLSNPWTTENNLTDRAIISVPSNPWEKTPHGRTSNVRLSSNEGPEQLISPVTGQHFVIYSAARSDNPDYCLGQLALAPDGDPMNPSDWTKHDGCVFYQDRRAKAYGVGHASFVKSPDGREDWIVYHGMEDPWSGWSARSIRTQRFGWGDDGAPRFPRPGYGPYEVPSGQA